MKLLIHLWRLFILWFVLGMCYAAIELLWRGVTYLPMIWIGGLCGLCIGLLNQNPAFCRFTQPENVLPPVSFVSVCIASSPFCVLPDFAQFTGISRP